MRRYREASGDLAACLRGLFEEVESSGLGSVYADVHRGRDAPEKIAGELLRRAGAELNLPLRAGIAPSKFLARLAAEEASSGTVYRLRGADTAAFLAPLPVERLPRVGAKTAARLGDLGARTVGEVLRLGAVVLEAELGNHGLAILEMARGQDRSPMRVARHPQSIGREKTFEEPSADPEVLTAHLGDLAASLAAALERRGLRARRVALRLVGAAGATTTRSTTLADQIFAAEDIFRVACELLRRGGRGERSHRGLGMTLAGLGPAVGEDRQLDLFPD
jgi:nucleotidyltransferase/DNA polymerase involved in DNA repair